MVTRSRPVLPKLMMICASALAGTCVMAQSGPLEEVVVVGSRIPQPKEQAVPITVITSEQLEQRGYTTVQQALDDIANNSGGGFDQQVGLSFAPAAAGLNLRDLGVGRALILMDGHRLPMYPIGWNGTDSFVDLSGIPSAAVARIEISSEGASAIYGSDAMSGVVNIVLKRRADNEVALRYGDTTQGGGAEKRIQLSTGAESDTGGVSLFVEYYQRKPLWYSQRERTRSDRLGGINGSGPGAFSDFGYLGTYLGATDVYRAGTCDTSSGSPGVDAGGICEFNRAAYRQVWPDIHSISATVKFDQDIGESLKWFAMLNLRNAKTVTTMEPLDFYSGDSGVLLFAGQPNNPTGDDVVLLRRMVEFGGQQTTYDTRAYNVHTGLKGTLAEHFSWQLGLQAAKLRLQQSETGQILNSRMYDALYGLADLDGNGTNDFLDLSKPMSPALAAQLEYRPVSLSESTLRGADLQVNGDLFALPAGTVKFAAVLEYFKESYSDDPDPELIANNVGYRQATAAHGERGRSAAGLELQIPIVAQLKIKLADRYDAYHDDSDVGGAFSPRVSVEYRPISTLLFRGSAGRSFRAPDMQRLFGGASSAYEDFINTPKCIADGGTGRGDAKVASCVNAVQVGQRTSANLHLQEERGTNVGLGVFWKPTENWSGSLDYFAIKLKQLVQTPDGQYVLDEYARNGSFADAVLPNDPPGCPTEVCLSLQPVNIAYKKVSGIDGALDYQWRTSWGTFSSGIKASYLLKVEMRESASRAPVDVLRVGTLGEATRWKGGADLGWSRNDWAANLFVNYIGGFAPFDTSTQKHLGSFTTVNANVAYALPTRASIQLGVNNIFNRMPPIDVQRGDGSQPFYHQQFHNVDGASWFVSYRQPF
jgi:iron complex outermembrane recepter protein